MKTCRSLISQRTDRHLRSKPVANTSPHLPHTAADSVHVFVYVDLFFSIPSPSVFLLPYPLRSVLFPLAN